MNRTTVITKNGHMLPNVTVPEQTYAVRTLRSNAAPDAPTITDVVAASTQRHQDLIESLAAIIQGAAGSVEWSETIVIEP